MQKIFASALITLCALFSTLSFAEGAPVSTESVALAAQEKVMEKININTADENQLAKALFGIGKKKAKAIVAYRKEFGPFAAIDELSEVKGIGKGLVKRNKDRITLQ